MFKKLIRSLAFSNRLLKAARLLHFEKIPVTPLRLRPEDRCLLLSPHPDDETLGCGGALLAYPKQFHVVCLTDGGGGGRRRNESAVRIRRGEFAAAMESVGISSYECLDIEDRMLIKNYPAFAEIDVAGYDYIFLPSYFDEHKDHKAVTVLLQKLLGQKPHKSDVKLVFYEVWSALTVPNAYLDISATIERKKDLIALYSSQLRELDYLTGIIALNRYRGMVFGCEHAEAYSVLDLTAFHKL